MSSTARATDEGRKKSLKRKKVDIDEQSETSISHHEREIDSDDEVPSNTIGSGVPLKWYDKHEHIGYDLNAKKVYKPIQSGKKSDEIDQFLEKMENSDYWRTVYDDLTGQNVTLTNDDINYIQRIKNAQTIGDDVYEPWPDTFSSEVMIHPILNTPESKASFIPSKWERLKVGKYVHAIKMGWVKPPPPKEDPLLSNTYDLWSDDKTDLNLPRSYIPAPKLELPGHRESYNPSNEYLYDDNELEKLRQKLEDDYDEDERMTKTLFIPQKFDCLRRVPSYDNFIYERFQRCLDLYLCPRQKRLKANITDINDLIPKLPKPQDLQPFPIVQSLIYEGHKSQIRCLTCHTNGQWLASGSDDCTVRVWEIETTRCMRILTFSSPVLSLEWNPVLSILAVACEDKVIMVNPKLGEQAKTLFTDEFLKQIQVNQSDDQNKDIHWSNEENDEYIRLEIKHFARVKQVQWQGRGDYFSCVLNTTAQQSKSKSVVIHHLSKCRSQFPFKHLKGHVQFVKFHPNKPILFICTQHAIKIYHLIRQELLKRLFVNTKWISSIDIHPHGDNLIIGGYDSRINWFDLDLSVKPYETYRYHKRAIRSIKYHQKLPLFASASDDGSCVISHCMVYQDLLKNPLIVPVKILRGHKITNDIGILDCLFHPQQPWIFTSGSDSTIRLYTN
ncbi:unnamed protein product [Didymodactylos carnosus]|uniref:Ribosome biogenesis protein BOP1 homolog n=1 Tax=Didymodactylos carnosus TaxID=1234261 RepID=A0A813PKT7_9BILA|nr:unnamed protein product [Didymodactylos carnosus]CAF0981872.1 unnamed protein product [Didymodactylos carnosus]CAF3532504.1 unnamed protein product [Didymodactylos carnosus]CAF3752518.1 unnamed protein product [Didymodactylos carnosus]